MYTIRTEDSFAAAHYIKNYNGKCENLHGHNYKVRIYVSGDKLGKGGMLIDFGILKKILKNVLEELDHKNLNEIPYFAEKEPSAEIIAEFIFNKVDNQLSNYTDADTSFLSRVDVFETDKNLAIFTKQRNI
ncbi:MAG: 6-carboxytetrahydropterin synthase QueD [Spirochaetaceae bacterium]|nr:6-carboxytetrahydropterin synthase QueD [Spirochaetaceae bacterium]